MTHAQLAEELGLFADQIDASHPDGGAHILVTRRDSQLLRMAADALAPPREAALAAEPRRITLEEYIEANGTLGDFLEGLAEFAKDHGLDWKQDLERMYVEIEHKARVFRGM